VVVGSDTALLTASVRIIAPGPRLGLGAFCLRSVLKNGSSYPKQYRIAQFQLAGTMRFEGAPVLPLRRSRIEPMPLKNRAYHLLISSVALKGEHFTVSTLLSPRTSAPQSHSYGGLVITPAPLLPGVFFLLLLFIFLDVNGLLSDTG